jgi:CheY-like chemotaxis protein/anti-sigma regulatory factor (Ser/Thr protein kinase)
MPTILVVDDSAVDRNLVGGLLRRDANLRVEFAVNGADGLEKIKQVSPDLVITDLMMPEMDGLQLVSAIREQFRLTPVILMTSQGSEELAIQALEAGAASYVPKRMVGKRLIDTVANVLAMTVQRRGHVRLMGSLTRSDCTFVLENDPSLINPLVAYVQQDCNHMGLCDATDQTRLGVALEEAMSNALYHGNLEVGSELREEDEPVYWETANRRKSELPYCNRRIFVQASLTRERGVFVIRDEGPGFDPSRLPDPTDPVNLERVSGRGVLLMRAFMDEVLYNETGNCVTLIKRRDAARPGSES